MTKILSDHIEHYKKDGEAFDYFVVENPSIRQEERRRIELLTRQMRLSAGQTLLDAGSGGGWVAQAYLPKGVFVCSVDLSLKSLKGIRERFDRKRAGGFVLADLYHLPFKNGAFDGATSNDVFEHLEDLDCAAIELRRVLKNHAQAFVSVPYRENIVYYLCIHCNQLTPINAHLHSFNEANLGRVFVENGFKTERVQKFMNKALAILQVHYLICRWMPYWLWRAIDTMADLIIKKPGRMAMTFVAEERL